MNPCEVCIIKMLCTVLCEEKINQIADKVVEKKKLKNPNFSKRGGVLLWDLLDELEFEGITVLRYTGNRIEVMNGTIKRTTAST